MSFAKKKDLPSICHRILTGKADMVVWGAPREMTAHEWQRQIPARFMIETQWRWWSKEIFHGLPVCSPSYLEDCDPRNTIVVNNYFYSQISLLQNEYLRRIGNHTLVSPLPLHEMARAAGLHAGRKAKSMEKSPTFAQDVNDALRNLVTPPMKLKGERLLPPPRDMMDFFGGYTANAYLKAALPHIREAATARYKPVPGRIALVVGSLDYGGAERQLANLAVALKRGGYDPVIFHYYMVEGGPTRYEQYARENGVAFHHITAPHHDNPAQCALDYKGLPHDVAMALWHMGQNMTTPVLHTLLALQKWRPEKLIAYLDSNNVLSGMAGILAGVPEILVSGRNVAPIHIPDIFSPTLLRSFEYLYPFIIPQRRVVFSNNSDSGAESYAKWLRVPTDDICVIPNCVTEEFTQSFPAAVKAKRRQSLGLTTKNKLILGVFRLAAEKRPLDFVQIVARLHKKDPNVRALICGQGRMEAKIRELIEKLGLSNVISLAGAVRDVPLLMNIATLLLHTSEIEGSPNVILEAQTVGLPIVCAENGGTKQFLSTHWRTYMKKPGDLAGLTQSCARILADPSRQKTVATVRTETRRETSPTRLVERTLGTMKESTSASASNSPTKNTRANKGSNLAS